ncbi:MAG: tetratricopeptide repeat protein [Bacteroidetes bacterium]|nr:tetratricopeptide repeat protein [Bacteroidota bacterium]
MMTGEQAISGKVRILVATIAVAAAFIAFYPTLDNGFVNWDDDAGILKNEDIRSLSQESLSAMFSGYYVGHYHPLTTLSFAIEYKMFGLNPKYFHLDNLLLHMINTVLVCLIFISLTKKWRTALLVGILFAIHPLNTESVAWITGRRDLLFSLFFLLSLLAYLSYNKNMRIILLIISFLLFVLSMLSKTSAVTLPVVLLLTDYFSGRKYTRRLLFEKLPFFAVSLVMGIVTVYALKGHGDIYDLAGKYSLLDRALVPFYALMFYIVKFFMPVGLCASYFFHEKTEGFLPVAYYIAPVFVAVVVILAVKMKTMKKEIVFGLLFFFVTISLFLQILPSGRVFAADRYTYLPFLGLFFVIAAQSVLIFEKLKDKIITAVVLLVPAAIVVILIILTHSRIKVWESGETLFTDMIEKQPGESLGYFNRGIARYYGFNSEQIPDFGKAFKDFSIALELDGQNPITWFNRGNTSFNLQNIQGALDDYNRALSLDSLYAQAYNNRGLVWAYSGNYTLAIMDYNKALEINNMYSDAYSNRGIAYYYSGDHEKACYEWGIAIDFGHDQAYRLYNEYCK